MRAYTCYVGLGSNLGDRAAYLRQALTMLANAPGVSLREVSSFYETSPWGRQEQPPFINAAAILEVTVAPLELLAVSQEIELCLGRERHEHWGARTIDIDLLHIPGVTMDTPELTLPHPCLTKRAFVLIPLDEIAADEFSGCLAECQDNGTVKKVSPPFPLKVIACVDEDWGIGYGGDLLAKIPDDLARFRRLTWKGAVVMGRKTFSSLPHRPLPGRQNIVLSQTLRTAEGFFVYRDITSFMKAVPQFVLGSKHDVFVVGGEEIYRELLPFADEAFITYVHKKFPADRFMVNLDERRDFVLDRTEKAGESSYEYRHYHRVKWEDF